MNTEAGAGEISSAPIGTDTVKEATVNQVVVDKIIHALNTGDIQEFLDVMSDDIHNDAAPGFQEYSKQQVRFHSGQGLTLGLHASYKNLWGRDIILVLAETEAGLAVHNILHPVVEGGEVVYIRSYYFCKELLLEVGRLLGVPIQTKKPGVHWA
jgi:RNA polymerase sigma-70 factor (ECF subfamily)